MQTLLLNLKPVNDCRKVAWPEENLISLQVV